MKRRLSAPSLRMEIWAGKPKAALLAPFRFGVLELGEKASPFSALFPRGRKGYLKSPSNPDSHQRLPPVKRKTSLHLATAARHVLASSLAPSLCSSSCLAALDAGGKKGWTLLSIKMFNSEDRLPPHLPRDQRCRVAKGTQAGKAGTARRGKEKVCAPSFQARALVRARPLLLFIKNNNKRRENLHLWEGAGKCWGMSRPETGQRDRAGTQLYGP